MCNYVPGECYAIGPRSELEEALGGETNIPGNVNVVPLVPHQEESTDSPFGDIGLAHVTNISHGLEVFSLSMLSARLSYQVMSRRAVVDLNYYLPFADVPQYRARSPNLSEHAQMWVSRTKEMFHGNKAPPSMPPIALIDSGVNVSEFGTRRFTSIDYSNGPGKVLPAGSDCDNRGHGTKVARILDAVLPSNVLIVSGKLSDYDQQVTVLNLCCAYASLVSTHRPAVVNISLAPKDDTFTCPKCNEPTCVPSFYSTSLPDVIRLGGSTSFTVMASGNTGQENNYKYTASDVPSLVFVSALGSDGERPRYSSHAGSNGRSSACAFGGDDRTKKDGMGVFHDDRDSWGTSFAAPFVSAAVYAALGKGADINNDAVFARAHHLRPNGWVPDWSVRPRWRLGIY